ncbi:hypothetical protein CEXT_579531 [Caerostris extrusa]|uniref:Uncharacterized protein n=1 Tax=Caerostris extrusa TaxID=172846 RepID=A0AAV4V191_CAEEX|nr:hypothetical protein CEXT_579531 [Caerostris extrusa]
MDETFRWRHFTEPLSHLNVRLECETLLNYYRTVTRLGNYPFQTSLKAAQLSRNLSDSEIYDNRLQPPTHCSKWDDDIYFPYRYDQDCWDIQIAGILSSKCFHPQNTVAEPRDAKQNGLWEKIQCFPTLNTP